MTNGGIEWIAQRVDQKRPSGPDPGGRRPGDRRRFRLGVVGLVAWAAVSLASRAGAQAEGEAIRGIVLTDAGVEITLFSSRGFPVRNEKQVLRIGEHEFLRSRYGADGDLHTLTFLLTRGEFGATTPEDSVVVQYGHGGSADRRDFGALGTGPTAR